MICTLLPIVLGMTFFIKGVRMKGEHNDTVGTCGDEHGTLRTGTTGETCKRAPPTRPRQCSFGVAYTDCQWGYASSCDSIVSRCLRYVTLFTQGGCHR